MVDLERRQGKNKAPACIEGNRVILGSLPPVENSYEVPPTQKVDMNKFC